MIKPLPAGLPALPDGLTYLGLGSDMKGLPLPTPDIELYFKDECDGTWQENGWGDFRNNHYAAPHDHWLVWANLPEPPAPRAGYRWKGMGFGFASSQRHRIITNYIGDSWCEGWVHENGKPRGNPNIFYAIEVPVAMEEQTETPAPATESQRYTFTRDELLERAMDRAALSDHTEYYEHLGLLVAFVMEITEEHDSASA